jgi:hypothetical protein
MKYAKQRDKRLCVRSGVTDVSFFIAILAKYRNLSDRRNHKRDIITYRIKLEMNFTESCPCSPRPVRFFGRLAPQHAPELKSCMPGRVVYRHESACYL